VSLCWHFLSVVYTVTCYLETILCIIFLVDMAPDIFIKHGDYNLLWNCHILIELLFIANPRVRSHGILMVTKVDK
jgi:hypothetical protein